MNRRKYLSTLAAGAALGTMAAGIAACGGGSSTQTESQAPADAAPQGAAALQTPEHLNWGVLTLYPSSITSIEAAKRHQFSTDDMVLKIPFYNNTGITINENDVIGFTLKKIGCPPVAVIAYNLITADDHQDNAAEQQEHADRNAQMDIDLETIYGNKRVKWSSPDGAPCGPN
jgi:hypothetical protein